MHQRRAIISESERLWAGTLEELRINRRLAHLWTIVTVSATQLLCTKSLTPTLTRHHCSPTLRQTHLQCRRTLRKQIRSTPYHRALPFSAVRRHRYGDVESVHEANAVRGHVSVGVAKVEVYPRGGGFVAVRAITAVGCGANVVGLCVVRSDPDPTQPVAIGAGDGNVRVRAEGGVVTCEEGVVDVGLNGGPEREVAVVDEGYG